MAGGDARVALADLHVHHVGGSAGGGGGETESHAEEIVSALLHLLRCERSQTTTATAIVGRGGKYEGRLDHEDVSQDCKMCFSAKIVLLKLTDQTTEPQGNKLYWSPQNEELKEDREDGGGEEEDDEVPDWHERDGGEASKTYGGLEHSVERDHQPLAASYGLADFPHILTEQNVRIATAKQSRKPSVSLFDRFLFLMRITKPKPMTWTIPLTRVTSVERSWNQLTV